MTRRHGWTASPLESCPLKTLEANLLFRPFRSFNLRNKMRGFIPSRRRKSKASHHINYPTADDESSVSGLQQDWVDMHLWQNYFCQVSKHKMSNLSWFTEVKTGLNLCFLSANPQSLRSVYRGYLLELHLLWNASGLVLGAIFLTSVLQSHGLCDNADSFGFLLTVCPNGHHHF